MRRLNTYNNFQRELASCGVKEGANQGVNHAEELTSCGVKEGANQGVNHAKELTNCEFKGVNHAEGILHVFPCSN